jgi:hypothetical protein
MTVDIKTRILRHENDRRHQKAMEIGLVAVISSRVILGGQDSGRIRDEGQNAVDEISARIQAEMGEDPAIELNYVSPNHDIHDRTWLGR